MEQLLVDLTAELAVIRRLAPTDAIASWPVGTTLKDASPADDRELLYALAQTCKTLAAAIVDLDTRVNALDGRVTALEAP